MSQVVAGELHGDDIEFHCPDNTVWQEGTLCGLVFSPQHEPILQLSWFDTGEWWDCAVGGLSTIFSPLIPHTNAVLCISMCALGYCCSPSSFNFLITNRWCSKVMRHKHVCRTVGGVYVFPVRFDAGFDESTKEVFVE